MRFENVTLAGKGNFLVSPGMLNIVFIVGSTMPLLTKSRATVTNCVRNSVCFF